MRFSNSIPGLCLIVSAAGVMVLATGSARGHNSYVTPWTNAYPTSTLQARMATATGSACNVCHQPPERASAGTCYKDALALRINAGRTISQAIADVDGLDSDGDGVSNHDEITAVRTDLPGQVGYHPGLLGATGTDPCGDFPTAAVSNARETPPPACRADFNHAGGVTVQDIFDFLTAYFSSAAPADINGVGGVTVQDIFDYLTLYFAGCP
jgi:hypothetical protein